MRSPLIYMCFPSCARSPPYPRHHHLWHLCSALTVYQAILPAGLHNMENASKQQLRVLIWLPLTQLTTWFKNNNTQSLALVGIIISGVDELLVVFSTSVSLIFPYPSLPSCCISLFTLHVSSYPLSCLSSQTLVEQPHIINYPKNPYRSPEISIFASLFTAFHKKHSDLASC